MALHSMVLKNSSKSVTYATIICRHMLADCERCNVLHMHNLTCLRLNQAKHSGIYCNEPRPYLLQRSQMVKNGLQCVRGRFRFAACASRTFIAGRCVYVRGFAWPIAPP